MRRTSIAAGLCLCVLTCGGWMWMQPYRPVADAAPVAEPYAVGLTNSGVSQIEIGNVASLACTGSYSVAIWVKLSELRGGGTYPMAMAKDAEGARSMWVGCLDDSSIWWASIGGATWASSTAAATTNWTHLAMSFDGTTCRLYVDGVADGTADIADPGPQSSAFMLGARTYVGYENRWPGDLDDAGYWNRVLSPDEIAWLAAGNAITNGFGLVSHWLLNDTGASIADAVGGNTGTGTDVMRVTGKVIP